MAVKNIYLVAYYHAKPRNPAMTRFKGYMNDPENISYDERVEFSKGLKNSALSTAGVILNLHEKKIIRNRFSNERTFDDLFKYFLEAYPQYVIQVMASLDMEYLEQFIPKEDPTTNETTADESAESQETLDEVKTVS